MMNLLRFRTAFGLALLGKALLGSAQQSTTIDITGVQFRNATNQSRSSVTPISPAFLYDYQITGSARGVSGALGFLYPTPTPLATIFESLAPGSSALLQGPILPRCGPAARTCSGLPDILWPLPLR